jgi:phytoene/squalene synthetase
MAVEPGDPAPREAPPLAIREHRPTDPRWRADLLSQSSHGRLVPIPAEAAPTSAESPMSGGAAADPGAPATAVGSGTPAAAARAGAPPAAAARAGAPPAEAAEATIAGIARRLLGDFAPALLLLPATERARARALLAYARMLFDCARQHGPEGERLAQIDRWQAGLDRALAGEPGHPPICLRMARESARRRWPVDALDELSACARRSALRPRPATAADAELDARNLGRAIGGALLEARLTAEVNGFAGALVRLHALQHLGEAMARGRCPLPDDAGPVGPPLGKTDSTLRPVGSSLGETASTPRPPPSGAAVAVAVERECARLRPRLLRAPRGLVELPEVYRRAGVFALLAALRLLSEIEGAGEGLLTAAPHLGTATRVGLLVRARWFGLRLGLR